MKGIRLCPGKLTGTLQVPVSKSIAHRALICSALCKEPCNINAFLHSQDLLATIEGMDKLTNNSVSSTIVIDCNESASTLRFLLPLALALGKQTEFLGRGSLGRRPIHPYFPIFDACGIHYEFLNFPETPNATDAKKLPLSLKLFTQGKLLPGHYRISGLVSSQFLSGLFFALPLLSEDSTVTLEEPLESKGYADLTISVLNDFGIRIKQEGTMGYKVYGGQEYKAPTCNYQVEGDYSQAAFFLAANVLGSFVQIENLPKDTLQPDGAVVGLLEELKNCQKNGKKFVADCSQFPDLVPILAVVAAFTPNLHTLIKGASRLRIKESDRLSATAEGLSKMGATVQETRDGLMLLGQKALKGGSVLETYGDHRMAMSFAVAATGCLEPLTLTDVSCVAKSYPDFFREFQRLGGKCK